MTSLYEEVNMIEDAINDMLYGENEIDLAALDNLMQAKTETIERGLEALCKIRARKQGEITALLDEIKRLSEKSEREAKALVRLESYIMDMYKRSGQDKVNAGTFTVSKRMSNSVWVSPDFNNPEYMRTSTTTAPDKEKIRTALKTGLVVNGAALVTKENLSVK